MQAPVFYLIYISKASSLMNEGELLYLLEQSQRNNNALGITGMLLYVESVFMDRMEGRFMQMLEGEEADVLLIYHRIVTDERNHQVLLMQSGAIEERCFPGWSMGFRSMDESTYQPLPGFFELNDNFLKNEGTYRSAAPLNLLRSFYQINHE